MTLPDARCLDLLQEGQARHPLDRALLLAAEADAGVPWADRPLGERDAALVALRSAWYGPGFETVLRCEACGEMLSATLDLRALPAAPAVRELEVDGVAVRLPTTRDLAALAADALAPSADPADGADTVAAASRLLERLAPGRSGAAARIEAAIEAADPLAHVEVELACERCGHRHARPLDIAANLWDDVQAQGERVLAEVHVLASAYGWTEGEILAMPRARRGLYLEHLRRVGRLA